jgi:Family of unknown function (DUF6157)
VYAVLHDIPKVTWPKEREKFLRKGHPHLRVLALAKSYGWGLHNGAEGKVALIAVESPEYKRLLKDPRTTNDRLSHETDRFTRSGKTGLRPASTVRRAPVCYAAWVPAT